ncbi:class I SAM-dependent DNA methyltransferase [Helicobacter ailurogastricus]|uniref:site-specific DNA-methyltransferase (adenine-specific) n=1 Tax=Helicobacter ailurogastricus TaxID=1578720 RepID=A0A0K2X741_9HELI|nr:N-6 DNA methylase [Helicobacter ailurogastricus]CRF40539.1 restriction enzyme BcgI alpha chain-like protein [Helicobacter ailurogastricus]CRF43027.1 restriction enzyme BcgI alpha chain-like protein [Helicobacter ailurogastricus]CRF44633.1 restriction enzyme BcgI alpha chain-like protein [Helicobacter ailurogastricus]
MPSQEETIEYGIKKELEALNIAYYAKTAPINEETQRALEQAPSKSGGSGKNYPDLKLLLSTPSARKLPVMIEVKGLKGRLAKFGKDHSPDLSTNAIKNYALNGALHYANAILDYSYSYNEAIAIGINGYEEAGKLYKQYALYYLNTKHLAVPQKIGDFSDLGILADLGRLEQALDNLTLSEAERNKAIEDLESQTEAQLNKLNQFLHDDILNLKNNKRVALLVGMIMAATGVPKTKANPGVGALGLEDLKSEQDKDTHDGHEFLKKIKAFLNAKKLPSGKIAMVVDELKSVFIHADLWVSKNNIAESQLKKIYGRFLEGVYPLVKKLTSADIAGKLFNSLTKWLTVSEKDDINNDVVLTPRVVVDLMVELAQVNKDSYVWDYAAGSGAFLISSMNKMIQDCMDKITNPKEREEKIAKIRAYQLLGVEKRADIYLLGVLNMLLLGDGSANFLHQDSLEDFEGNYGQGAKEGKPFNANVFLLNPPYSAKGKGFIFVERALERMKSGRAVVIIQENAGSGNGDIYTKKILEHSSLVASIKMPLDLFVGKSSVQTAIYVFEVGKAHNPNDNVLFIDFSNDGYTRAARKKARASTNLRDTDHAKERYAELIELVAHNGEPKFYKDHCIKDKINLEGKDWTYAQHQKIDTTPKLGDFSGSVAEFLAYEVSLVLKGTEGKPLTHA